MSSQWPTALSSATNLYTAVNLLTTTLSISMTSSTPSVITLASTTGFPTAGAVTIDNEVIFYTGVSGSTLTGLSRGADGTTAAAHNSGVPVGATIVAYHVNAVNAEIIALETDLHTRIGFGSTNQLVLANGVVGAPTISWSAASDTGFWSRAAHLVTVSSNGAQVAEFGTNFEISGAFLCDLTSNQLVLGTTRTVTINAPTPASSSRIWTIPDITAAGTFAALEGTQTFSGAKTFSSVLTMSGATIAMGTNKITGLAAGTTSGDAVRWEQVFNAAINFNGNISFTTPGTQGIVGQTANTAVAAGNVGEVIKSAVTNVSAPSSGTWGDLTSIALTAGHWLITGQVSFTQGGAASTECQMGISSTSGNSSSGMTLGDNKLESAPPASSYNTSAVVADYEVLITSPTTYYLKMNITYTSTAPGESGRISAVRIS